jgi:hypothetical protein
MSKCFEYLNGVTFPHLQQGEEVNHLNYFDLVIIGARSVNYMFDYVEFEPYTNEIIQQRFFVNKVILRDCVTYKVEDIEIELGNDKNYVGEPLVSEHQMKCKQNVILESCFTSHENKVPMYIDNNTIYAPKTYTIQVKYD